MNRKSSPRERSLEECGLGSLLGPWRARAGWLLDQQVALAEIAAPTGKESARADRLQRLLATSALATTRDAAGNVCAVVAPRSAREAPLVCLAHLDTVYADAPSRAGGALIAERDGLHVRCPGIGDNGRGLASLLVLADVLSQPEVQAQLVRPVHLVATVAEEGDGNLRGARAWFDAALASGVIPHAAIAIDGPGDESIVHQAVGSRRLRLRVDGPGGHSWVDTGTPNPLHALGTLITQIEGLRGELARRDASRERTTLHVTRMHGGESLTGVPQAGWIDVDLRSTRETSLAAVERELVRVAHLAVARVGGGALTVTATTLGERPAGALDASHPLVQAAVRATEQSGRTPRRASASTDANIPLARGIPSIAIGAGGRGGGAHTADEWYDDQDGMVGMERVVRLVLSVAMAPGA